MQYDRKKAVAYAHEWAFARNSKYYNFDPLGGDCTNFVSQCLHAGNAPMNYTRDTGWYYSTLSRRAAAWTGVPYLYKFLVNNQSKGPYGKQLPLAQAEIGDIIQLNFDGEEYSHSLLIVSVGEKPSEDNILVAAHTNDADYRRLDSYWYQSKRLIHIEGLR